MKIYAFADESGAMIDHQIEALKRNGLDGLEEARRFAADPILGGNLRTITKALLDQPVRHAWIIFGRTDAIKLRSCMTLFAMADPDCGLYARVLEEFLRGEGDPQTLKMLK